MRSSACSRLRKAIRALDGGEVHKGGSLGSQVRERRILATRERSDGRSGGRDRPGPGTGGLSSWRVTPFATRRSPYDSASCLPVPQRAVSTTRVAFYQRQSPSE